MAKNKSDLRVEDVQDVGNPLEAIVLSDGTFGWEAHAIQEFFGLPPEVIESMGGRPALARTEAGEEASVYRCDNFFRAMVKLNESPSQFGFVAAPVVLKMFAADLHRKRVEDGDVSVSLGTVVKEMTIKMLEDRLEAIRSS